MKTQQVEYLVIGGGPIGVELGQVFNTLGNSAVIFSEPEIGIAGLSEQQAKQAGMNVQVARYDVQHDARAQIAGSADGLLKIVFDADSRKVVGIHIMIEGAGEPMGEAAVPVEAIAAAIHPHPTLTESFVMAVRNVMAQHAGANKTVNQH